MKRTFAFCLCLIAACFFSATDAPVEIVPVPAMGESWLAFDSNPAYINDHAVIRDQAGKWHMIGITHKKVLGGALPVPGLEEEFAHAVADDLQGEWKALPPVLQVDRRIGETHVWAPHIVFHDGLYYCFYSGGGKDKWDSMLNLATSPDLMTWTRHPANPMFRGGYEARDPMVIRIGDEWVIYYTLTYSKEERYSTVAYRKSQDLVHWGDASFALIIKNLHTDFPNSGHTESPFLLFRDGWWYLFICTPDLGYRCTRVFASRDPFSFTEDDEIATLPAHCAEVIFDGERYWLSHAGWFFDGMYLAPLEFNPMRKFSPAVLVADAGESDDYLVSAIGARTVRRLFVLGLRAPVDGTLEWEFPVPAGAERADLALEVQGGAVVKVGAREALRVKGRESRVVTASVGGPLVDRLRVRVEDGGDGFFSGPTVYHLRVYYR